MAIYEFPYTENYDQDLGWLIREYEEIETQIDDLDTRVTYLEEHGGGGGGKDYDKEIADLYSKINTLTSTVNSNKKLTDAQITTINSNITSLTNRVSSIETKVTSLANTVSSLSTDNINNKNNITALQGEVTNINTDITNLDDSIDVINTTLTNYNARITALEEGGGGGGKDYSKEIKELQDGLASLTTTVNTNKNLTDAQITGLTTDITNLTTRLATLEESVKTNTESISTINTEITALQDKDEELRQNISSLSSAVGENTTKIGEVKSTVSTLSADVVSALDIAATAQTIAGQKLGATTNPLTHTAPTDPTAMEENMLYLVNDGTSTEVDAYIKAKYLGTESAFTIYKLSGGDGGSGGGVTIHESTSTPTTIVNGDIYLVTYNGYNRLYIACKDKLFPISSRSALETVREGIFPIAYYPSSYSGTQTVNEKIYFGDPASQVSTISMTVPATNRGDPARMDIGSSTIYARPSSTWIIQSAVNCNQTIKGISFIGQTIQAVSSVPTSPQTYQLYKLNNENKLWYYDGSNWYSMAVTQETPTSSASATYPMSILDLPDNTEYPSDPDDPNLS